MHPTRDEDLEKSIEGWVCGYGQVPLIVECYCQIETCYFSLYYRSNCSIKDLDLYWLVLWQYFFRMCYKQGRWKLDSLRGTKIWGKGVTSSKNHRFWAVCLPPVNIFCYFSWFFFPFLVVLIFLSSIFLLSRNFRERRHPHWKFLGARPPRLPHFRCLWLQVRMLEGSSVYYQ